MKHQDEPSRSRHVPIRTWVLLNGNELSWIFMLSSLIAIGLVFGFR
ncbi:MAG: hypothetical protein ACK4QW_11575 [Alphaproteobacteria bacterium]